MGDVEIGPVFAFSRKRPETVRFYREVVGLPLLSSGLDADWFEAENAQLALHDPLDPQTPSEVRQETAFVVWFGVDDLQATFKRAFAANAVVGSPAEDYFFARDPEGRVVAFHRIEHEHDHEHAEEGHGHDDDR